MNRHLKISLIPVLIFIAAAMSKGNEPVEVNLESGEAYIAGLSRYNAGDYVAADSLFWRAVALDSRNTAALFSLGLSQNKQRRFEEASNQFRAVIAADPLHLKAWQALPLALRDTGRIDEAIKVYNDAESRFPGESSFPLGKAQLLMRQGDFQEAIKALLSVVDKNPDNASVYKSLGYAYMQTQDLEKALESYRQALPFNPVDIDVIYMTAQIYAQLGQGAEASLVAGKVLELDPGHGRAHIIVADHLRETGHIEEALPHYRIASTTLVTKPYAEHYIKVIEQQLEEEEIEREWREKQN